MQFSGLLDGKDGQASLESGLKSIGVVPNMQSERSLDGKKQEIGRKAWQYLIARQKSSAKSFPKHRFGRTLYETLQLQVAEPAIFPSIPSRIIGFGTTGLYAARFARSDVLLI